MLRPNTTSLSKVYAEDHGLAYAVSRANQQDYGKRFETLVYLELRRRLAGRRTDAISSLTVPGAAGEKVDFLVGGARLGVVPRRLGGVRAPPRFTSARLK